MSNRSLTKKKGKRRSKSGKDDRRQEDKDV